MEEKKQKPEGKKIKNIVRVMNTDIPGNLSVLRALRKIKGINFMFANAICIKTGVNPRALIGEISDSDIKKMEDFIKNPDLPEWMINRQKDPETGEGKHLIGANLDLQVREDINLMRRIRAYRGIRHELGQPVRGQRTRSSFRRNKTVGVSKRRQMQKERKAAEKK